MKTLILVLAACGTTPTHALPDGGAPDAAPDAASDAAPSPVDGGATTISVVHAAVIDERADTISYATGEPIHTHHGAAIDLSTGCPDVSLYAYLLDSAAPAYGGEATPNPLAWQLSISDGQYRVRSDSEQLLDWTAMTSDTIALHRDHIPKLGTVDGALYLDVRAGDATVTFCWKHHPLAAPVELLAAVDAGELTAMKLANDAPIANVIEQGAPAQVASARFVQHVAEAVPLSISFAPPTATWTKTSALAFARTATGTLSCGTADTYSDDPRCSTATPVTTVLTPSSGTLAASQWSLVVIDEADGIAPCEIQGFVATCNLPPRTGAPHAYRIVARLDGMTDLRPLSTQAANDLTLLGRAYTGTAPTTIQRCDARTISPQGVYSCAYGTYARFYALDKATVAFAPIAFEFAVPYAQPAPVSVSWDAGTELLPGQ